MDMVDAAARDRWVPGPEVRGTHLFDPASSVAVASSSGPGGPV